MRTKQTLGHAAMTNEFLPFHAMPLPAGPAVVYVGSIGTSEAQALSEWVKNTNRASELVLVGGEPTLSVVIDKLEAEKEVISKELGATKQRDWETVRCKRLMNREQELFTTLHVLRELRNRQQEAANS